MSCRVLHAGRLSNSINVKTGVRQGCLLSPFLFLLAIDLIMRTATSNKRNGIQWILWSQLEYLDFADDLVLLSHKYIQMQGKTTLLSKTSEGIGLKIHQRKTQLMKINTDTNTPVKIDGEPIEEVETLHL